MWWTCGSFQKLFGETCTATPRVLERFTLSAGTAWISCHEASAFACTESVRYTRLIWAFHGTSPTVSRRRTRSQNSFSYLRTYVPESPNPSAGIRYKQRDGQKNGDI